jgi:hypothetical protein
VKRARVEPIRSFKIAREYFKENAEPVFDFPRKLL